ncbi:hypothetical protein D3C84_1091590 [compost metagenome]
MPRKHPSQPREIRPLALAQPLPRPLSLGVKPGERLRELLPVLLDGLGNCCRSGLLMATKGVRQPLIEPAGIERTGACLTCLAWFRR